MKRSAAFALAALLAACALLPACGRGMDDGAARELRRGNGSEPDSIDPQLARMEAAMTILRDCYEGLVSMAPDGTPVARRRGRAGPSPRTDAATRSGCGRPRAGRTAIAWSRTDFVAAWRRLVEPATASQYALMLEPVANAADIVAAARRRRLARRLGAGRGDARRRPRRAIPYFLAMLSHPSTFPVHRPTLAANPKEFARPGVAVTNGAFTPAEWAIGSHILAKRNAQYWNDAATKLDAVRYVHVADPATELTRFRAGDLDVTYTVPPGEVARLEKALPGQLHVAPTVGVYYYGFALDLPPFKDAPKLRQALAMAVDRDVLARQVLGDGERPAYGWVPPGVAGYAPQQLRLGGARCRRSALPRRSGSTPRPATRLREPLRVELRTSKSPLHDRIALAVTAMWKEQLGAEVSLRSEDFRVLKAAIDAREAPLFRGSWIGDYNDAYSFLQVLKGGFGINLPRYASDPYDVALAMAAASPGERGQRISRRPNASCSPTCR